MADSDRDSVLRPSTAQPILPFDETDTRTGTMATVEPTTRPVESEEPEVTPSTRAEPTTQSPSPSPQPTTSSSPPPTTSSPAPTTASPSPSPSETESEEPSLTSTSSSTSTSTSTSTSSTSTTPSSTSTSTASSSSSTSTSSSQAVETITSTVSQSRPGLVTSFSPITRSSTVSGAAASSTTKGGIGGSGLPVGGLVGIIIGALVVLCLLAMIVTRTIRKRARAKRTAHRSSMFEPWQPAPVTMEDEDDLEKARYSPPSQAYPMQNTGTYDHETYDVYGQAGVGAGAAAAAATYPPSNGHGADYQYPQQDYGYSGSQGHEYAQSQPGVPPAVTGATAASIGLRDGMMAKVQVGFNRTLEDELAIIPGQQLWLHTVYDDGWAMCEDQNQNRGVVPVTSLVPWSDEDPNHLSAMSRSNTGGSLSNTSRRRSSLYANAQAGNAYLGQPE